MVKKMTRLTISASFNFLISLLFTHTEDVSEILDRILITLYGQFYGQLDFHSKGNNTSIIHRMLQLSKNENLIYYVSL